MAGSDNSVLAHQYPICTSPEFLHEPNQYLHGRTQLSAFYLGKLALTNPQVPGKVLLKHVASERSNTAPDSLQIYLDGHRFGHKSP